MPFRKIYNCGLAIIVMQIISEKKTIEQYKQCENYPNIVKDIETGIQFWNQVVYLMQLANKDYPQLQNLRGLFE